MVIGMGFTIGIPNISQWSRLTEGGSGIVKRVRARGLGNFGPQYGLVQIPGRESGGRSWKQEQSLDSIFV